MTVSSSTLDQDSKRHAVLVTKAASTLEDSIRYLSA
jgi:hypothetical protein